MGGFHFSLDGLDGNDERPAWIVFSPEGSNAALIYEDDKLIGGTFASTLNDIQNLPEVREP